MARPKLGESDTERLHIKITKDELDSIDDWRFSNRAPSRSEAVRRLVQIGLAFERSQNYGASDGAKVFKSISDVMERHQLALIHERNPTARVWLEQAIWGLADAAFQIANFLNATGAVQISADRLRSPGKIEPLIEEVRKLEKEFLDAMKRSEALSRK